MVSSTLLELLVTAKNLSFTSFVGLYLDIKIFTKMTNVDHTCSHNSFTSMISETTDVHHVHPDVFFIVFFTAEVVCFSQQRSS